MRYSADVIVIGAGLAGLMAAWRVAVAGKRVHVMAKGWGTTHWHSGCIDVLGYPNPSSSTPCESPALCVNDLVRSRPSHPYGVIGAEGIRVALRALQALCQEAGYPLDGSLHGNWLLPTAVGAVRPTCLAPETMVAGDLNKKTPMLIVGMRQLGDTNATLAAGNLAVQGVPARGITIDVKSLSQRRFLTSIDLARLFDSSDLAEEVAELVEPHVEDAARIGFPAVLGLERSLAVKTTIEKQIGRPVFEIPTLPPSVPGIRLHRILKQAISNYGGQVLDGMEVVGADVNAGRVGAIHSTAAARTRTHTAPTYILATGGILGGGIVAERDGSVREMIFNLPLAAPADRSSWFRRDYFDPNGHPIHQVGVTVDDRFRPQFGGRNSTLVNVHAAGAILANSDSSRQRSHEGVAVATGYWAGEYAARNELAQAG